MITSDNDLNLLLTFDGVPVASQCSVYIFWLRDDSASPEVSFAWVMCRPNLLPAKFAAISSHIFTISIGRFDGNQKYINSFYHRKSNFILKL